MSLRKESAMLIGIILEILFISLLYVNTVKLLNIPHFKFKWRVWKQILFKLDLI